MTTGRIASTSTRPTTSTPPKATAPKAEAKTTTAAAAANWGGGAKAPTSLKITSASIGDGPKVSDKLIAPKGYTATVKNLSLKASDTVHGKKVGIEQTDQQVTIAGPNGKKVTLGGTADMQGLQKEWKSSVADAKKAPADEFMMLDWDSSHSFSGVGSAGKLISVSEAVSDFTGGAHPNSGTVLQTYDASTGKQVKLDQLLTQQQMSNLVKDIGAKLPKLKGPDGIDGTSFSYDAASLRDTINSNFALTTDKNGKVQITVAWESGVHALGGLMASFTVDAPTDAGFQAKIGAGSTTPPPAR